MKMIGGLQCAVAGFISSHSLFSCALTHSTSLSNALLYFSVWRDMGHRLAFSLLLWNRGTLSFVAWCPQKSFSRAVATKEFWSTSKTCAFHCNKIKMHGGGGEHLQTIFFHDTLGSVSSSWQTFRVYSSVLISFFACMCTHIHMCVHAGWYTCWPEADVTRALSVLFIEIRGLPICLV